MLDWCWSSSKLIEELEPADSLPEEQADEELERRAGGSMAAP